MSQGTAGIPARSTPFTAPDAGALRAGPVPRGAFGEIKGRNGARLLLPSRALSRALEVFKSGTELKVLSRTQDASGTWHIVLEEK